MIASVLKGNLTQKITCPQTLSTDLRFRNKVTFKDVVKESKAITTDMVSAWFETTLPTLLSNYNLRYIFNVDEFGLFYQALPVVEENIVNYD